MSKKRIVAEEPTFGVLWHVDQVVVPAGPKVFALKTRWPSAISRLALCRLRVQGPNKVNTGLDVAPRVNGWDSRFAHAASCAVAVEGAGILVDDLCMVEPQFPNRRSARGWRLVWARELERD